MCHTLTRILRGHLLAVVAPLHWRNICSGQNTYPFCATATARLVAQQHAILWVRNILSPLAFFFVAPFFSLEEKKKSIPGIIYDEHILSNPP